jgi:hypothetical protein
MLFKPMSGCTANLDKLVYPVFGSVKGDGIRTNIFERLCRTKSLKPLPNIYTRTLLESHPVLEGLEAELVTIENLADPESFNKATSAFMTHKGEPKVVMWIFDVIMEGPFWKRLQYMNSLKLPPFAAVLRQTFLKDRAEVDAYISEKLNEGYEGVILRHSESLYKFGKATVTGGELLKVKPFEDAEATIEELEEGTTNTNPKVKNELGRSKRSSSKAGLVPSGIIGTVIGRHTVWGRVRISGMKDDVALDMFHNPNKYLGELVTFKYQAHGTIDAPRIAKFKGIRSKDDV